MNDTPRTDAAMTRCACSSYVIEPDFARILEHENVLLRDDLDAIQHTLRGMEVQQERLERENAALLKRIESSDGWDDYNAIKTLQTENAALREDKELLDSNTIWLTVDQQPVWFDGCDLRKAIRRAREEQQ